MCCRSCGNRITPVLSRADLNGCHYHQRVNQSAIVFKFGMFSVAPGCEAIGLPVARDSWFTGFAWEVVVCVRCTEHVGWRFSSAKKSSIYGLITVKLVAQEDR